MKRQTPITLDSRDAPQLAAELLARVPGYVREWQPAPGGSDVTLPWIVARYVQAIVNRLNQAPEKHKLAFLELCGIQLITAQAARAPVVFALADHAADTRVPAGTRLMAQPPPERNDQILFETERSTGLAGSKAQRRREPVAGTRSGTSTTAKRSWPERRSRPSESASCRIRRTSCIWPMTRCWRWRATSQVNVTFELTTSGSEPLTTSWEYWDGKVWREFLSMRPACDPRESRALEGTLGLTRSGTMQLRTDCAETARTKVNGIEAFWIRGRLDEPLPADPVQVLPEIDGITLDAEIRRPLEFTVSTPRVKPLEGIDCEVTVLVTDEGGKAIPVDVTLRDSAGAVQETPEDRPGVHCFHGVPHNTAAKTIEVTLQAAAASPIWPPRPCSSTTPRRLMR